jgi:DNA-binding response OmpR family regulator
MYISTLIKILVKAFLPLQELQYIRQNTPSGEVGGLAGERVLIVDDEPEISQLLSLYLTKEGYEVTCVTDGSAAIDTVRREEVSFIILDVLLPGLDGIEVCTELRKLTDVPIVFLSCRDEDIDKVMGLVAGGDDYITKPFSPRELVARVKAHLRRYRMVSAAREQGRPSTIRYEGLEIDLDSCEVKVRGEVVYLSHKEFELLSLLAQNPDKVFSADDLFEKLWKMQSFGDIRTVMVHISNLRKKIERNPAAPEYILTVRGAGYKFNGSLAI